MHRQNVREKTDAHKKIPPTGGGEFLVYQTDDGQVKLHVRLENETLWLTQQHMAELFQTTQQNISQHITNIFDVGSLGLMRDGISVGMRGSCSMS